MRSFAGKKLFEELEPRCLFSSVVYSDGIVTITGNPGSATTVHITNNWANLAITGVTQRTTIAKLAKQIDPKRPPQQIRINLGNASDNVIVDPDVKIPVYVDAEGGNDKIAVDGSGNSTVVGGTGNDWIQTGKGKDYVQGGSGNDTVAAQTNDTVWGQSGNDVVTGALDMSNLSAASITDIGVQPGGGGGSSGTNTEFTIGSTTAQTVGFSVAEIDVATLSKDGSGNTVVGADQSVPVTLVSQTINGSSATDVFSAENGGIVVTATMKTLNGMNTMDATVTNNTSLRVTQVLFGMPRIYANVNSNFATMSGFHGGTVNPWPTTSGYTSQDGGTWPGVDYSPIAAFYDSSTNNGVGIVAFNNQLDTTKVSWVLSNQWVTPGSRMWPNLDKGQSVTFNMAEVSGTNMPTDVGTFYRSMYLAPFMATLGIPEANYVKTGVWGDADWVNAPDTLTSVVQNAMSTDGVSGWVQWSPSDGDTPFYEGYDPASPDFPWTKDVLATSKLSGLQGLGVLIDPFESARVHNPNGTVTQVAQSLDDPAVQSLLLTQRNAMVKLGINFAYWDTGGQPRNGSNMGWLNTLLEFKRVGITVAPEASCDIAAWITGAVMGDAYTWNSFTFSKAVTPNATMFMVQNSDASEVINGKTVQWWDDAQSKGIVPILNVTQLQERLAELGLA